MFVCIPWDSRLDPTSHIYDIPTSASKSYSNAIQRDDLCTARLMHQIKAELDMSHGGYDALVAI
jgi:hypothetical protein